MRWNIRGRDSRTGNFTRVSIEAPSLAEAEKIAQYNGLAVIPEDQNAPLAVLPYSGARLSEYGLKRWARWLGWVSILVGVAGIVLAVMPFVRVIQEIFRGGFTLSDIRWAMFECVPGLLVCLAALTARMLSAAGRTLADFLGHLNT